MRPRSLTSISLAIVVAWAVPGFTPRLSGQAPKSDARSPKPDARQGAAPLKGADPAKRGWTPGSEPDGTRVPGNRYLIRRST